jgi:hypothetical protein
MRPDAPHCINLLCLTPDDFTRQVESAANQRVKQTKIGITNFEQVSSLVGMQLPENTCI